MLSLLQRRKVRIRKGGDHSGCCSQRVLRRAWESTSVCPYSCHSAGSTSPSFQSQRPHYPSGFSKTTPAPHHPHLSAESHVEEESNTLHSVALYSLPSAFRATV